MNRHQPFTLVVMILLIVVATACGHSTKAPTAPSDQNATVLANTNAIAIVPATNVLKRGETQQFTMEVALGAGVPPSGPLPEWTSDNVSVLVINSNGAATGVALGESVVQVRFRGQTAIRRIQVVPE